MFGKQEPAQKEMSSSRIPDFAYLSDRDVYTDTACQSLRPQPVLDELQQYFTEYNACGGRVKYAWGNKVDDGVTRTRAKVLSFLGLPVKDYSVSFSLNTTYGINLILGQLPRDVYQKVITSDIEHNSVFLPTLVLARRLGVERLVLERADDGTLPYDKNQLTKAIVVVNTTSNIDGRLLQNVKQLVDDAHAAEGIVILDAAQTMAHHHEMLVDVQADAIMFSAHKMYAPSLGVIVIRKQLLESLDIGFIGGGMLSAVRETSYDLLPDDPASQLEPGLQDFGAIIALGKAIDWLGSVKPNGQKPADFVKTMSEKLYSGLKSVDGLNLFNAAPAPVISVYSDRHNAHRLAIYLSEAGIMARSGSFCCHYYLITKKAMPPLLRFSIGLHTTEADVQKLLETLTTIQKG
jgi:selenocysteine lyase/cysteine desulfurase